MTVKTIPELQQTVEDIVKPGYGSQPIDMKRFLLDLLDTLDDLSFTGGGGGVTPPPSGTAGSPLGGLLLLLTQAA